MPDAGNGGNTVAHPQDLAHLVVLAVKGGRVYFGAQQVNDLAGIGKHLGRLGQTVLHLGQAALHAPVVFLAAHRDAEAAQQAFILRQLQRQLFVFVLLPQKFPDLRQLLGSRGGHIPQDRFLTARAFGSALLIGIHQLVQRLYAVRLQGTQQLLQLAVTGSCRHVLHLLPR